MFDVKGSAEKLKSASTKTILLPISGAEIVIRKITVHDFVACGIDLPTGETARTGLAKPEDQRKTIEMYLTSGVVAPKIIIDESAEVGDEEIHAYDLGGDLPTLISEIMSFSNLIGDEGEAVSGFPQAEKEQREDDSQDE